MGWVVFWVAVVVLLTAMWFAPRFRRRSVGHAGPTDGPSEHVLREAERYRGNSGWGPGV